MSHFVKGIENEQLYAPLIPDPHFYILGDLLIRVLSLVLKNQQGIIHQLYGHPHLYKVFKHLLVRPGSHPI